MKKHMLYIVPILFVIAGVLPGCNDKKPAIEEGAYYTCPMHPEVKKNEPGQCPVCLMDLIKKEDPSANKH
jgi:Cu(I)/Ag(I) efflux system membrane fusion protein